MSLWMTVCFAWMALSLNDVWFSAFGLLNPTYLLTGVVSNLDSMSTGFLDGPWLRSNLFSNRSLPSSELLFSEGALRESRLGPRSNLCNNINVLTKSLVMLARRVLAVLESSYFINFVLRRKFCKLRAHERWGHLSSWIIGRSCCCNSPSYCCTEIYWMKGMCSIFLLLLWCSITFFPNIFSTHSLWAFGVFTELICSLFNYNCQAVHPAH